MKHLMIAVAVLPNLSACLAPLNDKVMAGLCEELFKDDARTAEIIATDAQTDLAGFCTCYAETVIKDTAMMSLHKDILSEMTTAKGDSALNIEQVADLVEAKIEAGEIDTFDAVQFDDLGDYFQDVSFNMGEAGGTCPAS